MRKAQAKSLPVLMYHYINDQENSIAVSRNLFEEHCRALAENGKRGISLAEAEAFLLRGEPLPRGAVLITFDDGYCDNYLQAMPILARFGHKGTVFVVTQRVEAGDVPRAALEDVLSCRARVPDDINAPVRPDELGHTVRRDVFCNRGELRAMAASGVMDVAAHGRGHFGVFLGPEFEDFHRPGPQWRTFYRTEQPWIWGLPKFKVGAGLAFRGFLPSPELIQAVTDLVPQEYAAADAFFKTPGSLEALKAAVAAVAAGPGLGRMETETERRERMWRETAGGKAELEDILGGPVRSLCWPWGKYCAEALDIGREAGFSVFFTTREGANPPGRPLAVHRFKAKSQSGDWLVSRVRLYERPWIGALYAKIRL